MATDENKNAFSRYGLLTATFLACALTCFAYEATRVFGWFNRFGPFDEGTTFADIAFGQWNLGAALQAYLLIFLPFFVVVCNRDSPKIRAGWLLFSLVALVNAWLEAPGAVDGRWGNSTQINLVVFYMFVVSVAAAIFIAFGLWKSYARRRP